MNKLYILVAGSRDFTDYKKLAGLCDTIICNTQHDGVCIVSGGARGADKLAEQYANENCYELKVFPAKWDTYGKSAGYIRNAEMHNFLAEQDNRICVCFWDGKSKGTQSNFKLASDRCTLLYIYNYTEDSLQVQGKN